MITINELLRKKKGKKKIVMLTAYDYPMARILEKAGIDMILVGDSGGMVKLGYDNTIPVTLEEMLFMTKAVRRGAPNTFIIADMPFMTYNISIEQAITNAGILIKEGGADAIKLEGGVRVSSTVKAIIDAGIAVQGHIGITPQNITQLSGYHLQGKNYNAAKELIEDALSLENSGVFSIILEVIPVKLADFITNKLKIPTIGTGSGNGCSGQNLITPDILGYYDKLFPKYAKKYTNLNDIILDAVKTYKNDVDTIQFPTDKHTYSVKNDDYIEQLIKEYN